MNVRGLLPLLLLFLLLAPLYGCRDNSGHEDIVATVDGDSITFREVEARRARLFSGVSAQKRAQDDEELREQYLYAVRQIAEELVICQYMEKKGFHLEAGELEAEEARIRQDYPEGAFEQVLLEEGISLDLWREELRRAVLVKKYITMILRPEQLPSPDAMLEYYNEHKAEFVSPEQWRFIQITGMDKKEVETARDVFLAGRNATDVQKRFMVTVYDVQAASGMLPEAFLKELGKLSPWSKAPAAPYEKEFRVLVLLEKIPATPLDAATITARAEQALTEDKLAKAYGQAVNKLMSKARIRIASSLLHSSPQPGDGFEALPFANSDDAPSSSSVAGNGTSPLPVASPGSARDGD